MPNKPKTPLRNVRVPSPLWEAARSRAAELGDNLSDIIRKALEDYVK